MILITFSSRALLQYCELLSLINITKSSAMNSLSNATFLLTELLEDYWELIKQKRKKEEYTEGTFNNKFSHYQNLTCFLASHHLLDIRVNEIGPAFAEKFKRYLLYDCGHGKEYTAKIVNFLKAILDDAVLCEKIESNRIEKFTVPFTVAFKNNHLELEELNRIATKKFRSALQVVADLYLFACYTGLGFSELHKFTISNIVREIDGTEWISISRNKSRVEGEDTFTFEIPLFPEAKAILRKYDWVLPKRSNTKMNTLLKEIAIICNIRLNLTTHTARKTFAIFVLEYYSFSMDALSYMLGHKTIRTVEKYYARIRKQKVKKELMQQQLLA
jgi:integrase/recombinase XerD